MKRKNNQPFTVDVLEDVLDKRFELFGKQFTERITTQLSTHIVSQLMEYIDIRIGAVEINQAEMKNTLDWLVGAYKKFEEEHMILTSKYTAVQHRLDKHEDRLVVLEK